MVGEWVNEDANQIVKTECKWSDDGNYLLRRFEIQTARGLSLTGTQRTGWDPVQKKLRSWTFDSSGGFFSGVWTQSGNSWILTSSGVSASGEPVSSTAIYTVIDSEMLTWQYQNLIIGDEVRRENEPVVMVRRPPSPGEQTASGN